MRTALKASSLSVGKSDYLHHIKRAIAYNRMLPIPEEIVYSTWITDITDDVIFCGWVQVVEGIQYIIVLIIKYLSEGFEHQNPPRTTNRIGFLAMANGWPAEVEAVPDQVAEDSLNALPYETQWGLIAGVTGATIVGGLVIHKARTR